MNRFFILQQENGDDVNNNRGLSKMYMYISLWLRTKTLLGVTMEIKYKVLIPYSLP